MDKIFKYSLLAITFIACEKQSDNQVQPSQITATTLDLSKYIAVGNSWAAGYMNGGLYRDAQLVSYPNIIAQQFKIIGGSDFAQPLFDVSQADGTGYLKAISLTETVQMASKTAIRSNSPLLLTKFTGANNNLGIAGLQMGDVTHVGLGNPANVGLNAFYERLLPTAQEDKTYVDFVKSSQPTFFTLSLGDDDIQAYAVSGGTKTITDVIVFSSNCQKLLDALIANGAKGIVANVPDILQYPYFNYYTFDEFRTTNGNADIYITTGNGLIRKATKDDLFLFKGGDTFGTLNDKGQKKGLSASYPMNHADVLDGSEVAQINSKVAEINQILKKEADARSIPMVDVNAVFKQIKLGQYKTGSSVEVDFSMPLGGFFSLDAVHPTARGYAIIANEFIKVINTTYKNSIKTTIPLADVSKFAGVKIGQ